MLVFLLIILTFLVVTTLLSFVFPMTGSWERMSAPNESIWDRERITLRQFAFFVSGERELPGGKQRFSGYALGAWVFLKRRDYGAQVLMQQGFPENIAPLVEGRVTLSLTLKLTSDRLFLKGYVRPYRIEFYEDGSGIKSSTILDPIARSFRRSELTLAKEPVLGGVAAI